MKTAPIGSLVVGRQSLGLAYSLPEVFTNWFGLLRTPFPDLEETLKNNRPGGDSNQSLASWGRKINLFGQVHSRNKGLLRTSVRDGDPPGREPLARP
jgi:hypothetical protein